MIEFKDSFGIKRAVDVSYSACRKWVNLTLYSPDKVNYGYNVQIPKEAFKEFRIELCNLKEEE